MGVLDTTAEEVLLILSILKKVCAKDPQDCFDIVESEFPVHLRSVHLTPKIILYNQSDESNDWKHLCVIYSIIRCVEDIFLVKEELACLSVQQTKDLKDAVGIYVKIGILNNLQPTLLKSNDSKITPNLSEFVCYKRLLGALYGITTFTSSHLKPLFVTNYLRPILLAFYQIMHCPLKKPSTELTQTQSFVMTPQIYSEIVRDRDMFKFYFKKYVSDVDPMLYIHETMLLLDKSSPTWLKKSLSNSLSIIICSPKGVQNVVQAMLDSVGIDELDDTTKSWSILLAIAKLVLETHKCPNYRENICKQLCELLELRSKSGEPFKPFERLFALCTKMLYQHDQSLCEDVLIRNTLQSLMNFTNTEQRFEWESKVVDVSVQQSIRICYYLTSETRFDISVIPINVIYPVLNVVFRLFLVSVFKPNLHDDIKNILLNSFDCENLPQTFGLFDTFLFGYSHKEILEVQKELEVCTENSEIIVKRQAYSIRVSALNRAEAVSQLIADNIKIQTVFFSYLLNCLSEGERYFSDISSATLLEVEDGPVSQEASERNIVVYKLLSDLALHQSIQTEINANPTFVTKYIHTVLQRYIATKVHKTNEFDSDNFQTLFLLVMLLQAFVENAKLETKNQYVCFVAILKQINDECRNPELQELCLQVVTKLGEPNTPTTKSSKSELDTALEDLYDPLLPVRGHALITLAKLIEKRNKDVMEKKQFILNLFMQNLKNSDSFIYLGAIGGLAALGDVFPGTVLNTLADEYVDFSRKGSEDGHEVRMKLGEVLVRITKALGDMAPKYKTLLLNTFLEVTKDEDHLMRASSMSNLGEVCKVLGYKLGTIVNEVLVCVHSIITTDKAPEPRRAAVTVLRQLFVGLEKEMIVFLKDDILPIYRTLKHIYHHDKDDIMRLQAQLALEQLNENMKDFVFPNPQLHTEKEIVMLN